VKNIFCRIREPSPFLVCKKISGRIFLLMGLRGKYSKSYEDLPAKLFLYYE